MSELKTKPNSADVNAFLDSIEDEGKRSDANELVAMMRELSGAEAAMWGESIVGFGRYHYRYASGREGEWFRVGFSPRKRALTIYITSGFEEYASAGEEVKAILARLGKHSTGKACLYVKRLSDIDIQVLRELVRYSLDSLAIGEQPDRGD